MVAFGSEFLCWAFNSISTICPVDTGEKAGVPTLHTALLTCLETWKGYPGTSTPHQTRLLWQRLG